MQRHTFGTSYVVPENILQHERPLGARGERPPTFLLGVGAMPLLVHRDGEEPYRSNLQNCLKAREGNGSYGLYLNILRFMLKEKMKAEGRWKTQGPMTGRTARKRRSGEGAPIPA